MTERDRIAEIDLHAYADGLLDRNPIRKAAVEAHLRAHPAVAIRVADYVEQNARIRALYDPVAAEPLPAGMLTQLGAPNVRRAGTLRLVAGVAGIALLAGMTGWWIGKAETDPAWPQAALVRLATASEATGGAVAPARSGALDVPERVRQPIEPLRATVTLDTEVPDLSGFGLRLHDMRIVSVDGRPTAQLRYAGEHSDGMVLFLRPRWHEAVPDIAFAELHGTRVAYWRHGPLEYALVARLDRDRLMDIANDLRLSMHPRVETAELTPPPRAAELEASASVVPIELPSPGLQPE